MSSEQQHALLMLCSAGNTALTYACCGGYEEVVRLLLEAGAEVEHQNENGHTPLMEAASCGHVGEDLYIYQDTGLNQMVVVVLVNGLM